MSADPPANALLTSIAALDAEQRKKLVEQVHPHFLERQESYRRLLDAYEGSGGFLDGSYLYKYPNETDGDYADRQKMHRYHNYLRALVNIYVRHVFREGVKREAPDLPELTAWWANVDGNGTPMDTFMKRGAKLALVAGIAGALVDKEPMPAVGPSKADDPAQVIASWFPASSIVDWLLEGGALASVKLREPAPRESILDPEPGAQQTLVWTRDAWVRLDADGQPVGMSTWTEPLGFVPLAIVRPDPSAEHPFLGYALGADGQVFVALFNRCSEEDEVLRDQAFSILTCNVGKDGDVAAAKTQIGNDIGTTRALVVAGEVNYATPSMEAPEQIRKNIEFLIREIYRMAHVRFERDSLDAESADAIRLQFTELNEQLANLADELQRTEMDMAKAWYAWTHPGDAEATATAFADESVVIAYPREFFLADLLDELKKWAEAIRLDLGPVFEHYAKKRVVDQLAPDLDEVTRKQVHDEIDGMEQNREKAMAEAQARLGAGVARLTKKPEPPKPGEGDGEGSKAA